MQPARLFKIFLRTLVVFLSVTVLTLLGLGTWVVNDPRSVWQVAEKYVLPSDLNITWDQMDFTRKVEGWRRWHFRWDTQNLLVRKTSPEIDVGWRTGSAELDINLFTSEPWFVLEKVNLQGTDLWKVSLPPNPEPTPEQGLYRQVQGLIESLSQLKGLLVIRGVEFRMPRLELRMGEPEPWVIGAEVTKSALGGNALDVKANVDHPLFKGSLQGVLDSSKIYSVETFLTAQLEMKAATWSVKSDLKATYDGTSAQLPGRAEVQYKMGKKMLKVQPEWELKMTPAELLVTLQTAVTNIPGPIVKLDKVHATFRLPLSDDKVWSDRASHFTVTSGVDLFLIDKNMRPTVEAACKCRLPEEFALRLEGDVWLAPLLEMPSRKTQVVDARLTVDSVKNKLFSADLALGLKAFREKQEWFIEPKTDMRLMVHSYQGLRKFLDARGVLIPAPFDILEGTIEMTAQNPVTHEQDHTKTTAQVLVKLASPTQKVLVDTAVHFDLSNNLKALDVFVEVLIRQLKLELPPLEPALGVPSLVADSRVLRAPAPKPAPSSFQVRVFTQVRTETTGAIQLLSKFAKPFAPLSVQLHTTGPQAAGKLKVEPFVVEYLRRKIYVETVELTAKEDSAGAFPLKGRFRIEQGGYKIFVDLGGTSSSPSMSLSSDPFLPKADIISVLLYGRVSDKLVSGEAEAAGSFNAAVADRAIGIFGLWAFASTPIESFSYNAVTKVYTATVRLGEGLTAGVGTNWENATNLELRKRLSRRWILTASWSPSETRENEGKVVLQWEKRF